MVKYIKVRGTSTPASLRKRFPKYRAVDLKKISEKMFRIKLVKRK